MNQIQKQKTNIENPSADWDYTRQWVESETGMDLSGSRFIRLRDAFEKSMDGGDSAAMLRGILTRPDQQAGFLERLTGQLTVGESFFFRNEHHFRVLREIVLPQIVAENRARRELRVWSAGCATGEEPYSLAILLDQLLGAASGWKTSVLGTDLNPKFLHWAREACYRQWSFRQTDINQNREYFRPEGDMYRLVPRLREHVRFTYLNLVKDVYPSPLTGTVGLDLILFRNVAIYLKPEVTAAILTRFYQALRPGGWLLLGETEVTGAHPGEFEIRRFEQATLFQKRSDHSEVVVSDSVTSLPPAWRGGALTPGIRLPNVPKLPEWVPLPVSRGAATRTSGATLPVELVWDHIEEAINAGKLNEAERRVDRVPEIKQRASWRLRFVRSLLARAEVAYARRMLELCLKEEPLLLEAQLLTAGFAEEAGDLNAAEQACRRAVYINPNAPMAHFQLALVLERKGDTNGVARSLKTSLKLLKGRDPHALVEFGEGVCHGRLQEMILLLMANFESTSDVGTSS
ncbi:MAG: CheR family methyltransferase [Planctomycetaceae bacterium]